MKAKRFRGLTHQWRRFDLKLPFTPWKQDRFEIRFDYFNVFNTPIFRYEVGGLSDGDVTNPFFNQPHLNSGVSVGATGARSGRLQLRYVF